MVGFQIYFEGRANGTYWWVWDLRWVLRKGSRKHKIFVLSNWMNGNTIYRDWEDWKKKIKSSANDVRCLLNFSNLFLSVFAVLKFQTYWTCLIWFFSIFSLSRTLSHLPVPRATSCSFLRFELKASLFRETFQLID